ncbi:MAG: hypothetical protein ACI4GC_00220 [Acutalibacteraceae bacterium]
MKLSIEELGKQYEQCITVQNEIIAKNRQRLNEATKRNSFNETKRLNTLLKVLYDEKWELEEKLRGIKQYYT